MAATLHPHPSLTVISKVLSSFKDPGHSALASTLMASFSLHKCKNAIICFTGGARSWDFHIYFGGEHNSAYNSTEATEPVIILALLFLYSCLNTIRLCISIKCPLCPTGHKKEYDIVADLRDSQSVIGDTQT